MPFSSDIQALPSRLGQVETQHFNQVPAIEPFDIHGAVGKALDHVAGIIDTFSPLSRAEKKQKLYHSILITKLQQDAINAPTPEARAEAAAALGGHAIHTMTELDKARVKLVEAQTRAVGGKAKAANEEQVSPSSRFDATREYQRGKNPVKDASNDAVNSAPLPASDGLSADQKLVQGEDAQKDILKDPLTGTP